MDVDTLAYLQYQGIILLTVYYGEVLPKLCLGTSTSHHSTAVCGIFGARAI